MAAASDTKERSAGTPASLPFCQSLPQRLQTTLLPTARGRDDVATGFQVDIVPRQRSRWILPHAVRVTRVDACPLTCTRTHTHIYAQDACILCVHTCVYTCTCTCRKHMCACLHVHIGSTHMHTRAVYACAVNTGSTHMKHMHTQTCTRGSTCACTLMYTQEAHTCMHTQEAHTCTHTCTPRNHSICIVKFWS